MGKKSIIISLVLLDKCYVIIKTHNWFKQKVNKDENKKALKDN